MPDLYRLTPEQLQELDGYGEISSAKATESIQESKAQPFSRVLLGLNIPKVGWVMARNLARHFGSVDALMAAAPEELLEVEGIGPDRAELVAEWFADEDNRRLVEELRALGLQMSSGEAERPIEGPLSGKQYVITGTLESWSREEAKASLEALGAKVSDSVSGKDDRRDRRGEPWLEAAEGAEARRGGSLGGRPRRLARDALARSRSGPVPLGRTNRRRASRSGGSRTRSAA